MPNTKGTFEGGRPRVSYVFRTYSVVSVDVHRKLTISSGVTPIHDMCAHKETIMLFINYYLILFVIVYSLYSYGGGGVLGCRLHPDKMGSPFI